MRLPTYLTLLLQKIAIELAKDLDADKEEFKQRIIRKYAHYFAVPMKSCNIYRGLMATIDAVLDGEVNVVVFMTRFIVEYNKAEGQGIWKR